MSKLAILGGRPTRSKKTWKKNQYGERELKAVQRVIKSGKLSEFRGGKEVQKFEKEFAKYIGTKYTVATSSGTAALHASIAALSLEKGNEVLIPALTFVSTASVLLQERLKPVFVDVDDTFCLDPKDLEKKISKKAKAIIPVHLYGQPTNMNQIKKIAQSKRLYVIEDACQAHGAKFGKKKVGAIGDLGCFSFFQTKNMSCGEGGMITTSNKQLYLAARLKREHGSPADSKSWYSYSTLGYNYNMTEVQAAIGRVQLKRLDIFNKQRVINAKKYLDALSEFDFQCVKNKTGRYCVYHNFTLLLPGYLKGKRGFFVNALRAEGIPVGIAYPYPLYNTKLFQNLNIEGDCPKAEDVSSRLFNLPTDPTLDQSLIEDTRKAIIKVIDYLKRRK